MNCFPRGELRSMALCSIWTPNAAGQSRSILRLGKDLVIFARRMRAWARHLWQFHRVGQNTGRVIQRFADGPIDFVAAANRLPADCAACSMPGIAQGPQLFRIVTKAGLPP